MKGREAIGALSDALDDPDPEVRFQVLPPSISDVRRS
jgi:hypothetical protein